MTGVNLAPLVQNVHFFAGSQRVNLEIRQSRQANDSARIVERAKERFRNSES